MPRPPSWSSRFATFLLCTATCASPAFGQWKAGAAAIDITPENLLINASHTHCGPELRGVESVLSRADPERAKKVAAYQAETEERLVAVVGEALVRREPAGLFFGRARAGFAMNRRIWEEGGYEGGGSLTYYASTLWRIIHPNIWDPSVEELIVGKVHELARKVSGGR